MEVTGPLFVERKICPYHSNRSLIKHACLPQHLTKLSSLINISAVLPTYGQERLLWSWKASEEEEGVEAGDTLVLNSTQLLRSGVVRWTDLFLKHIDKNKHIKGLVLKGVVPRWWEVRHEHLVHKTSWRGSNDHCTKKQNWHFETLVDVLSSKKHFFS